MQAKKEATYSIIIPHYNSVPTLKILLASIPVSADYQIIVIDDNSKADMSLIKELVLKRGGEFYLNETGKNSAGTCRNIGLSHAKGKWVLFADADDFFTENLPCQLEKFSNHEVDIIFFAPDSLNLETGLKAGRHIHYENLLRSYQENPGHANGLKIRYCFNPPWSKLIRKTFLEENNILFEDVIIANDMLFSTKCGFFAKSFAVCLTPIYCITKSRLSLTASANREKLTIKHNVNLRRIIFLKQNLSESDWNELNAFGLGTVIGWFNDRLKLIDIFRLIRLCRRNKIRIMHRRYLNVFWVVKEMLARREKIRNKAS
ncbi:MAG: glycosyltransferase family 2 protein [Lachnospiraceae bacterium]|nr:glycosyltransferase family 2 protein [Lachnospiraceae bacterium]